MLFEVGEISQARYPISCMRNGNPLISLTALDRPAGSASRPYSEMVRTRAVFTSISAMRPSLNDWARRKNETVLSLIRTVQGLSGAFLNWLAQG